MGGVVTNWTQEYEAVDGVDVVVEVLEGGVSILQRYT